MQSQYSVGVLGGGSWGTALAISANRAGSKVYLTTRNKGVVESITEKRVNEIYLPNVFIDPAIEVTESIRDCCNAEILIIAVPSHCMRSVCIAISDFVSPDTPIIIGSKGIEKGSLFFMSEVVSHVLPRNPVGVLSGPNFASLVANSMPSATTIACEDVKLHDMLSFALGSKFFRPYTTTDVIGTQVGGAIKNVIAIACGIVTGKGYGENSAAALITRGFNEMSRLALVRGARLETLTGLSGLGDLVLTCSHERSRNMAFGIAIGQGRTVSDVVMYEGRGVVEGITTAESVVTLAKKYDVEMPICAAVHKIINENIQVERVIDELLSRPFIDEGIDANTKSIIN